VKAQTSNLGDQRLLMGRLEGQSDAELLERSIVGDENAFLMLYERLKVSIFRYAFYMTNSKTAAEEVTQEVFICLLKDGQRYRKARGDLAAFAFGITRNLVRRLQRRERIYQELPSDEALKKLSFSQNGIEEVSAQAIRNQRIERLRSAIASLPDRYRQVIVLCDLCDCSYADAASRLKCALGTVRSRLSRAHTLLSQKLKQSKNPEPELPAAGKEECLT
jgi:RNA polymerase sigma-70 factor, ECF subfamily